MPACDYHHSQSKHSFDNNNKIFITLSKQDYCRDLHYLNVFTRNLLVWLCWWLERSAMMKMALRYTIIWNLETAWTAFTCHANGRHEVWPLKACCLHHLELRDGLNHVNIQANGRHEIWLLKASNRWRIQGIRLQWWTGQVGKNK